MVVCEDIVLCLSRNRRNNIYIIQEKRFSLATKLVARIP